MKLNARFFYTILKIKLEVMGCNPSSVEFVADPVSVELFVLIVEVGF